MNAPTGQRMRKTLACTASANAYQKAFGVELKRRVVVEGEPFAIVQADTPHEIFHVMDIPIITNQWWSAYISAKQLSSRYFQVMADHGFPENSCKYCSLGFACTLANDPSTAPWGGLPEAAKETLLRGSSEPIARSCRCSRSPRSRSPITIAIDWTNASSRPRGPPCAVATPQA